MWCGSAVDYILIDYLNYHFSELCYVFFLHKSCMQIKSLLSWAFVYYFYVRSRSKSFTDFFEWCWQNSWLKHVDNLIYPLFCFTSLDAKNGAKRHECHLEQSLLRQENKYSHHSYFSPIVENKKKIWPTFFQFIKDTPY